ncbi:MAG: hypothetical protein ACK5JR_06925 [Tropicimonas sp.]|uniref:hypothetical protein n=1 Tax=Tropicimonas sp. TaxID=2067044 RepID=UPI003A86EFDE
MTRLFGIALATALTIAPAGLRAQDESVREGFSLLEEGAKLLLRGLAEEVQPMMEGFATEVEPKLRALGDEMAPLVERFGELVDDLDAYHAPERLPNGDIILRRKTPQEMAPPVANMDPGEIEI